MSEPLPPPGWYADAQDAGRVRWWDGTAWTPHSASPPSQVRRPVWSRSLVGWTAGWLATLAASLGTATGLAVHRSDHGSWWPATAPLLIELAVTIIVGAIFGWRHHWREACLLGLSSGIVVVGTFIVGLVLNPEPGADDGAAVGIVVLGVPTVLAITALVLLGSLLGVATRWTYRAVRPTSPEAAGTA